MLSVACLRGMIVLIGLPQLVFGFLRAASYYVRTATVSRGVWGTGTVNQTRFSFHPPPSPPPPLRKNSECDAVRVWSATGGRCTHVEACRRTRAPCRRSDTTGAPSSWRPLFRNACDSTCSCTTAPRGSR